jgi:cobaltochelatase CobN
VDLGQSAADIVILSAADTDLRLLADACEHWPEDYPSLRLANLLALRSNASVDLYVDRVLQHARLVVVVLMGGVSYWPHGVEQLAELASERDLRLVLVPGDDTPDPELERRSNVPPGDCQRIWRYLREGGPDNARALLDFLIARHWGRGADPGEARPLPRVGIYRPGVGAVDLASFESTQAGAAPVAALLFYRAHLQSGNLTAFDALVAQLSAAGLRPLPIFVASLKEAFCRAALLEILTRSGTAIVLNTTGFAIASWQGDEHAGALGLDRPVLQVIMSGGNIDDWRSGLTGLSPSDLAMSVVLPEVDGRIITRAVSFKGLMRRSARAQLDVAEYCVDLERARFVAELAARWVALARTAVSERRVAIVLANYPARDGRIGNGVGLDTPASTVEILRALAQHGYDLTATPADGAELMQRLQTTVTNELAALDARGCEQSLALEDYREFLRQLPPELVQSLEERWGPPERDPRVRAGRFVISGMQLGAIFVGIQPARGYEIDLSATYHDPDLVPPHGYLAFYAWLRNVFRAHALMHVGKHGSLEWLPGKSVALGPSCWPDAIFGPYPHLYPFIVNDPGEGAQAKRRAQAVIIGHLVPPLTRAESYGPLRDLERLIDEYYQALVLDPPRARSLRGDIFAAARAAQLHRELGFAERPVAVRPRRVERGAGEESAESEQERFLMSIDAYLCELKESQIRDGLHVFGRSPVGRQRIDTLVALARHTRQSNEIFPTPRSHATPLAGEGLLRSLARSLFAPDPLAESFDPLQCEFAAPWTGPRPAVLAAVSADAWRTHGDTRERLELYAQRVLAGELAAPPGSEQVVRSVFETIAPALDVCGEREIAGLLTGLDGRYVAPGPSGAPSRGRLDVLPTGRNFFAVDVRSVPTAAAYRLAQRAAENLVQRYVQDHGEYPRSIGLSVWGTATMRTGGDDVAQALALLGVRPVWAPGTGRVVDTEIVPASTLRRPRVDVVLRISGFFRDAFPDLIRLLDAAVRAVAELDEPAEVNPLRARVLQDGATLRAQGLSDTEAHRRARFRIFGSKPGSYGAGLQGVIDQGNWRDRGDLAEAYLAWSSYAYSAADSGEAARPVLETRLKSLDAVLQNQDNREHDLLDSDDYYQFQGGLSAATEQLSGARPALYHGDHSNPDAPRVRSLREEIARVVRSRVVNPKWIEGVRRHGYKGAAEMAATVDFVFGYDAATDVVEDYQYALLTDAYLLDGANRAFLAQHNPSALREMTERLLDAMQRGMWRQPGEYRPQLEELLLDVEESAS